MKFWKMHGLGNDYVVMDDRKEKMHELKDVAKRLCIRRFGIGADGILLVNNSKMADVKMRMFNPDGSEAEMCGNGIRCFLKFCFEKGIISNTHVHVETLAGVKEAWLNLNKGKVTLVKVNMGQPLFKRETTKELEKRRFINQVLMVNGKEMRATALSMGNPHCVIFVTNLDKYPVAEIGPKIEKHEFFPGRTNVEFVQVDSQDELHVRTWERGAGETLACGTGACASVVAATVLRKIDGKAIVHLLGGDLMVEYFKDVFMTGPAEKVYEGIIR